MTRHTRHQSSAHWARLLVLLSVLVLQTGCATISSWWPWGNKENGAHGQETAKQEEALQKHLHELKAQNEQTKKQLAKMKLEMQSLKEQLATSRRNIQILSRGARSGLFYDDPAESKKAPTLGFEEEDEEEEDEGGQTTAVAEPQDKALNSQPKGGNVSTAMGKSGFSEEVDEESEADPIVPARLLADAELKMQRAQYGEAVVLVQELQKKFPQYEDGGSSSLILAEAWVRLSEFNNAFPVLRSFYLKHPNSSEKLRAKLIEAQALEGQGTKEKAASVYQEVIALGPQTSYGQRARASLQRMRDAR